MLLKLSVYQYAERTVFTARRYYFVSVSPKLCIRMDVRCDALDFATKLKERYVILRVFVISSNPTPFVSNFGVMLLSFVFFDTHGIRTSINVFESCLNS